MGIGMVNHYFSFFSLTPFAPSMSNSKIGGRVGFDKVEDLKRCFEDIDFPIELALPWKYQDLWLPVENRLNEVLDFFLERGVEILSIHATQGKISGEPFLEWGKKTLDFAEALDMKYVTIHPEQVKSNRTNLQEKARINARIAAKLIME